VCACVCAIVIRDVSAHAMTQLRFPDRSRLPTWRGRISLRGNYVVILLSKACQPALSETT